MTKKQGRLAKSTGKAAVATYDSQCGQYSMDIAGNKGGDRSRPVRRGHGDQRGLALIHWHVRRVGEASTPVQLALFGGAG